MWQLRRYVTAYDAAYVALAESYDPTRAIFRGCLVSRHVVAGQGPAVGGGDTLIGG